MRPATRSASAVLFLVSLGFSGGGAAGAGSHDDCVTPAAEGEPTPSVLAADGHLAPVSPPHYERLARLSADARPGSPGLDRRQFALSAMSPAYLKVLDVAPVYLDVPPETITLPMFPANSSEQTRAELDHLLELQESRTPAQVETSQQLAGVYYRLSVRPGDADWPRMRRNLFHMGRQLGHWFAPERLPVTTDFMARVWSDASYYLWAGKFRFNRIRPYDLEPRLQNLETPNFPAYPSGHSGNSYVAALVYAELLPQHRQLFLRNAADMAYSREILGVHFASDSTSGRQFAEQLVERLRREPAFQRDLEAARRELAAVPEAAS